LIHFFKASHWSRLSIELCLCVSAAPTFTVPQEKSALAVRNDEAGKRLRSQTSWTSGEICPQFNAVNPNFGDKFDFRERQSQTARRLAFEVQA